MFTFLQAERERESVVNDGWLDDHLGLLSNHYITIAQQEVDRFQVWFFCYNN